MQTIVVIWDQLGQEPLRFFTSQDQRFLGLDQVYINTWTEDPAEEAKEALLTSLMYDSEGHCKQALQAAFPVEAVRQGAAVIVCGFLP